MLRIGNCSGFYGDRLAAMREMLEGGRLDVLTGDYLAELTMLILARDADGYAKTFLAQLNDCLRLALDRRVRIVANAGGVNPSGLADAIRALAAAQGLAPRIAVVRGDTHAYLGAFGIARALTAGADIVVTGRVTDASLVIGPAIARYGWWRTDFDALAGATVAGHVLECGTQATGGNYAFFDEIEDLTRPGFPIAEIEPDGSSVITKHPGTGGAVTVGTVTAQLVYEIQDCRYAGPDVTTRLDSIRLRQIGQDQVQISGVRGEAPPPTIKVGRSRIAGFRNAMTVVLTGLDIEAKAALFRRQFEASVSTRPAEVTWTLARLDRPDAPTEQQASALLTVVARDPDEQTAGRAFSNAAVELALASYPGFFGTAPPGRAQPYGVFTAEFVPQEAVAHEVVLDDGAVEKVAPPEETRPLERLAGAPTPAPAPAAFIALNAEISGGSDTEQPAHGTGHDGPTRRLPLGTLAGARSGDKGGDANIGLWVRDPEAYPWLCDVVSESALRTLLPELADLPIRIAYLPDIRAVNVVIDGLLGQGVAYNARFDPQAKGLAEWLRSRHVDIPVRLLEER
ncbi:DUF1446 domain-containing protein [Actinoplanes sp. TBRC 11911]|uniref:acyclic terpene utilization AtuA family protein n=1 Tax=Actinoplanes sp. TBRC 11911 TaxID=2729386 RepID=UPI00145F4A65|nr:acyclic terpene utilization AtuA family protein [Actinoplanes sp. TBRC 11911]NMO57312.1 DUF1446 domain-containing protein [Actinoplanes sp. TBRC 11911]